MVKQKVDRYQVVDGTDVLQLGPRYTSPVTGLVGDYLVAQVFHRTIRAGRSVLVTRQEAERLHAWLGRWLAEGWDGTPRVCGRVHRAGGGEYKGAEWTCAQPPEHAGDHAGPATGWRAETGWPGRCQWPRDDAPYLVGAVTGRAGRVELASPGMQAYYAGQALVCCRCGGPIRGDRPFILASGDPQESHHHPVCPGGEDGTS
jgi:hypothetical protein